jgi:hypothetical protein
MAQTIERNAPWSVETEGIAVPPAVVCALNGSPPGRAAAAYAAALARALEWRLGLVASGLRPLELRTLAEAVVSEDAGIVVQPSDRRASPSEARDLARQVRVPVVAVPARGWDRGPVHAPIVAVVAQGDSGVAGLSTRLALALETTVQLVHPENDEEITRLIENADPREWGLIVVGVEHAAPISGRRLAVPVMFAPPSASNGRNS